MKECYKCISIKDKGKVFNIDLLYVIEVGYGLDVVEVMVYFVILCKELCGVY